jgi:hypothetical protein
MNQNDISTYELEFNYGVAQNENIKTILKANKCGDEVETLSDTSTKIAQHFMDCVTIFALDELNNPSIIYPSLSTSFLSLPRSLAPSPDET